MHSSSLEERRQNESKLLDAIDHGDLMEVESLLLGEGFDVDFLDQRGFRNRTPLYLAARNGDFKMVELLIKYNANVNFQTKIGGFTPLHTASRWGRDRIVQLLLANQADVGIRDNKGYTALHWASANLHLKVVQFLLNKNVNLDVNCQSHRHHGWTPLHCVVSSSHSRSTPGGKTDRLQVVQVLVENGANIYAKTNHWHVGNRTPEDLARVKGHGDIAEYLLHIKRRHQTYLWLVNHWMIIQSKSYDL